MYIKVIVDSETVPYTLIYITYFKDKKYIIIVMFTVHNFCWLSHINEGSLTLILVVNPCLYPSNHVAMSSKMNPRQGAVAL